MHPPSVRIRLLTPPTLLILAAGRASRFGGPKQFTPVGPSGEPLLAYTIFDAARAGFGRVVIVCPPGLAPRIRDEFAVTTGGVIPIDAVEQEAPAQRGKPWGTGHAVAQAMSTLQGEPFGVANGDDWYGPTAIKSLGSALRSEDRTSHALVTYQLSNTLVWTNRVSRGRCVVRDGVLKEIYELTEVRWTDDGIFGSTPDGSAVSLSPDEPVSMNLWGFAPSFRARIEKEWETFQAAIEPGDAESEFLLTDVIAKLLGDGTITIEAIPTDERPFGLTRPDDLPRVKEEIARYVADQVYPSDLRTGAL